jgi:cobalt/nickel transport system permease protein
MHIMEGFLPAEHCIAWTAVSAPFVVHGGMKLRKIMREHPQMRLTLAASVRSPSCCRRSRCRA